MHYKQFITAGAVIVAAVLPAAADFENPMARDEVSVSAKKYPSYTGSAFTPGKGFSIAETLAKYA